MSFCEVLKGLRQERGITQREIALACGLTPTCICSLEQGTRNPTGSTVATLARFFGVSADYLLGLENDYGVKSVAEPMGEKLTASERELIAKYRKLSPDLKEMLNGIIGTWTGESATNAADKKTTKT